ncbi:MAG: pentapeptide repeat-containing protein, partial [Oculatellaceae cyanobacterium bins.114]|nr:pentapeptide repeat-containing protein [Oculatellaceae cyanobacterium bins.114]
GQSRRQVLTRIAVAGAVAVAVAGAGAVASLLLGIYCSRRALKGDEKFALLRALGVAFGALGGTRFHHADLTHTNFTSAILKSSNFREAVLTQVCWHEAQKLDRARVGESILADAAVRELLVTRNGYKKSYVDVKLRGANLNGVNLEQANLTWADLSEATLHQANLKAANLREVLAIGTDFTGAYLTGVCLESWNIDHTTQLKEVDCQYIFLLETANSLGSRERRPHDPEEVFQPGDFEKLYHKMINVVQVLFRNGMNRAAFAEAFQALMAEHPDISYDAVQAIERKGNDALVTLEVAETADKAAISRTLQAAYEEKILQLEAKVERLHELRAADLKDVAMTQKAQIFNQLVGGGNAMQSNHDSSQNISVGGNFNLNATNSVVNLRDISGTVTNTINQLPDATDPAQPNLKDLLTQLQQAIESAVELPDPDKADLLEQVKVLAEVPQTPEPAQQEGMARRAKKLFEATLKSLPDTAKIVEACTKLLPMILKALGLPL